VAQIYRWQDERGVVHYTNTLQRIPESYRFQLGPLPPASVSPAKSDEGAPSSVVPAIAIARIPYTPPRASPSSSAPVSADPGPLP
jgi:hypothetical protein